MAKLLLFFVFSLTVDRGVSTNDGRRGARKSSTFLLPDYAAGSVMLRERFEGNEGLLVVQDSAFSSDFNTDELDDETSAEDGEMSGEDFFSSSGSGSGSGGSTGRNRSESAESSGSSSSGVEGSAEREGSGRESSSDAEESSFREWLAAELVRMTTVVYDCRDGSETVGDWRNETVGAWLLGSSESHTNDSFSPAVSLGSSDGEGGGGRERNERFIFGEDEREFVTRSSGFPQCAVARMTTGCTAFFVGPWHALTAAHCVNSFLRGWRGRIRMWRERNCHERGFHGACSRVFAVLGHTRYKMYEYDYALVELDRSGEPAPCWFGIGYVNPWDYPSDRDLEVLGYPADKRRYTGQPECSYEAMWRATCNVSYSVRQYLLQWCDVLGGNSGSPVFSDTDDGNKVVYGIHAHSVGQYVYNEDGEREIEQWWNQGPMLTPLRYHQILRWMKYE